MHSIAHGQWLQSLAFEHMHRFSKKLNVPRLTATFLNIVIVKSRELEALKPRELRLPICFGGLAASSDNCHNLLALRTMNFQSAITAFPKLYTALWETPLTAEFTSPTGFGLILSNGANGFQCPVCHCNRKPFHDIVKSFLKKHSEHCIYILYHQFISII